MENRQRRLFTSVRASWFDTIDLLPRTNTIDPIRTSPPTTQSMAVASVTVGAPKSSLILGVFRFALFERIGNHHSTQRALKEVVADIPRAGLSADHRNHAGRARPMGLAIRRHAVTQGRFGIVDATYFALVNSIQTREFRAPMLARIGTSSVSTEECAMKKTALALFVVPFLTMPVFAGSSVVVDKPIVVAQGVDVRVGDTGVRVGERDRHRDRDLRRHHRDRAPVVVKREHRHHDRHHDRDHDRR